MKKLLALMLVLITCISLFAGCGAQETDEIVLPVQKVENTYENRVAALLETAKAYHYKALNTQYCSLPLSSIGRAGGCRVGGYMNNTPEMAGPQRTTYLTCSSFTFHNLYHTFDFEATDVWWCGITNFIGTDALRPYIVYEYVKAGNTATDEEKLAELFSVVQPGDMLYCIRTEEPNVHAVIWGGDLTEDGQPDIIHVGGTYYDEDGKIDVREEEGAVWVNTQRFKCSNAYEFFNQKDTNEYYPAMTRVVIYRFCGDYGENTMQLSERAKTRLLFPGLEIYHEVEGGIYGSVVQGEELTYTLTIKNNSKQNHKGIKVQLPVPENAEIVKIDGKEAANKTVKLTVDIPAGETAVHTVTVKATGEVGSVIRTGTGYVHAIPLTNLNTAIAARKEDAATVAAAISKNEGKSGEALLGGYLQEMGLDAIPNAEEVLSALFVRKNIGTTKVHRLKDAADIDAKYADLVKMQIPDYFGGQTVATEETHMRVKELRNQDLQAGDILIWQKDSNFDTFVAIHNGETLMYPFGNKLVPLEQFILDEFLMYRFFIALRPAQAK